MREGSDGGVKVLCGEEDGAVPRSGRSESVREGVAGIAVVQGRFSVASEQEGRFGERRAVSDAVTRNQD
jgi:hypothetical protein